jgi:hypothetical protein
LGNGASLKKSLKVDNCIEVNESLKMEGFYWGKHRKNQIGLLMRKAHISCNMPIIL